MASPYALEDLWDRINQCTACPLGELEENQGRRARGRGNPDSRVMVCGEAPGRYEAKHGFYFVGRAGQLLDQMLLSVDLDPEEDVWLSNVNRCRPAMPRGSGRENRAPTIRERSSCLHFLEEEVGIIKPRAIVCLGKPATEEVLDREQITMARTLGMHDTPDWVRELSPSCAFVYVLYHPSYVLRRRNMEDEGVEVRKKQFSHLKKLKEALG